MQKINQIRRFNRTVTQYIGALDRHFLGRPRSLGASRVLYEIDKNGLEIRELRDRLELDSGYTSRLIHSLKAEGLIKVCRSESDGRVRMVNLTQAGLKELALLNQLADDKALSLLKPLTQKQQGALTSAMNTVQQLVSISNLKIIVTSPFSAPAQDCITNYYEELSARFDRGFDPKQSISAEPEELTPPHGYFVVAQTLGRAIGCGAIKCRDEIGEIKRMWVDGSFRGFGVGRRILQRLEQIARENNLSRLRLETNKSLKEAQSLYRSHGYRQVAAFNDEPYADFWFEKILNS